MGPVKDFTIDGSEVTIYSQNGKIVLRQVADFAWKVTTLPKVRTQFIERKSITLTGRWKAREEPKVSIIDQRLVVSADRSKIYVDKRTSLLSFVDNDVVRLSESTCLDNSPDSITISFKPQNEVSFHGGGYNGRWGNIDGKTLVMNNTQAYNWDQTHEGPNNICVPFIVSSNGYGILFEDHYIDALIRPSSKDGVRYGTKSPTPISYVYVGSKDGTQASVMETYATLTGTHELPPYWALGYITSRYGYHSQKETEDVVASFEKASMPLSGVVLDLFWEGKYNNGMGNLDWYKPLWPDAKGMMTRFKSKGIHTVVITEPYFAEETVNYLPLLRKGLFADADCPGMTWVSHKKVGLIDFMNSESMDFYWKFYKERTDEGVDGWWLDLGEPEMISEGTIHSDGSTHLQAHNEFGMKWIEGVWKKWKEHYPKRRPFFMPRSGTSGMHRYATFPWTGDIARSWSGLKCQVPALINGGMSGLGYLSSDIGGFVAQSTSKKTKIVDAELYLRWFQMGVFTPMLRSHSQYLPEPYQKEYGIYRDILRQCIIMRYRLLPYIYSLSWRNTTYGTPITTPVNFYTEEQSIIADLDDQYLFGPNILVAPISEPKAVGRDVILPSGEWVEMTTLERSEGGRTIKFVSDDLRIPVFLRCGTFTPLFTQKEFGNIDDVDRSQLVILYPMGKDKSWEFVLYDDDHISANVEGNCEKIAFNGEYSGDNHVISITQTCEKDYARRPKERVLDFVIKLPDGRKFDSVSKSSIPVYAIEYDKKESVVRFRTILKAHRRCDDSITLRLVQTNRFHK